MQRIFNLIGAVLMLGTGSANVRAAGQGAMKPPAVKTVSHWDTKNALVVPFEYSPEKDTSPAVWLRINGSEPHLFIVDTGCTFPLMLTNRAAEEMKLDADFKNIEVEGVKVSIVSSAEIALYLPATKTSAAKDIPLPTVSLANITELKNPIFITDTIKEVTAATDGDYSAPVVGLLGIGFLRQAYSAAQFDFVRHEMTLYPKITSRLRISGATTVPIHLTNQFYAISIALNGGKKQDTLIDTGNASKVFIPETLSEAFNTIDANRASETIVGARGEKEVYGCLLPKLHIGNFVEEDIQAATGEDKDLLPLLGINFLSRFRVTLDYAHNEMTLERASDYKKHLRLPALSVPCGVTFSAAGLALTGIAPHSAPTLAGIQNFDKLLAVNGVAITEKNANIYSTLFPPYAGDPVALRVQHKNGELRTVHLTMPGLYDDLKRDPQKGIGIELLITTDYEQMVDSLDAGSLAGKAGFQKDDIIIAVNGKPVAHNGNNVTLVDTFIRYGQSVTFTVKRKGEEKPRNLVIGYRVHK